MSLPKHLLPSLAVAPVLAAMLAGPALASIHPGDQLSVHVFNHPELSSDTVKVDSSGHITIAVVGPVKVAGLEAGDVAKILKQRLTPYVPYPAVDVVDSTEATVIFVAGGPGGVIPFSPGETLATALADVEKELQRSQSGATATSSNITDQIDRSRIDIRRVSVIRDGKHIGTFDMQALRRVGNPGPALFADDTVSFADKPVEVNILGDVVTPGKTFLWADEPMTDAIAQAGGLQPDAATGRIQFSREGAAPRLIALGDSELTSPAQEGDTINFPTAPRVTVAGMVYTPGVTTLKSNFTLLSAMYSAGGIQKWANLKDVQVTHQGDTKHYDVTDLTHGNQSVNPQLSDGDLVFVPEGHKIDYSLFFATLFSAGNLATRF